MQGAFHSGQFTCGLCEEGLMSSLQTFRLYSIWVAQYTKLFDPLFLFVFYFNVLTVISTLFI